MKIQLQKNQCKNDRNVLKEHRVLPARMCIIEHPYFTQCNKTLTRIKKCKTHITNCAILKLHLFPISDKSD